MARLVEWTVTTLKELLEQRIADLATRLDERHSADQDAIGKADRASEKRFDGVNEFRSALADQQATFLTRTEYEAKHEALASRIDAVERAIDQAAGRNAGVRLSAGALVGGLSGLAAFITVVIVLANVLTGK